MRSSSLLRRSSRTASRPLRFVLQPHPARSKPSRFSLFPAAAAAASHTTTATRPKAPGLSRLAGKRLSTATPGSASQEPQESSPSSSSDGVPSPSPEEPPEPGNPSNEPPSAPAEDAERVKTTRRTRTFNTLKEAVESVQLPEGLDIIWDPATSDILSENEQASTLPSSDIFDEALHNLHIALHPQTQHRAAYLQAGTLLEPTLALYCPIEGGEYVIDATVRELARKTGSEVVILDSVHLAAGEWGMFGKAAKALQLPRNPLHFPAAPAPSQSHRSRAQANDDEDGDSFSFPMAPSFTVMAPVLQGRSVVARRSSPPNKIKLFFDSVIDISSSEQATLEPSSSSSASTQKPRIIYIRDFTTLASSSSTWYPQLLAAVRQRRRGPISRPSSPVPNPMVIVFGITPPLLSSSPSASEHGTNLSSTHLPGSRISSSSGYRINKSEWGEDDMSTKSRESRLRDRLRKWEKGESILTDELPAFQLSGEDVESDPADTQPEVMVVGNVGFPAAALGQGLISQLLGARGGPSGNDSGNSQFFRTSVLVPQSRSTDQETACRIRRRREINELTMRMGIGQIGGILQSKPSNDPTAVIFQEGDVDGDSATIDMWEDWGKRIEVWPTVRQIADHTVGDVVATSGRANTLDPTEVPWLTVERAWKSHRLRRRAKKAWVKESFDATKKSQEETDESADNASEIPPVDEVVERLKQDPDLEQHETRLLPCIVDPRSMQTSFKQVHLPQHTIDSVRTIVSLPLLHPAVFRQGVLKEHAMTGCLLFGPPGTGKTMLVKALAKEAGCRMMNVSPSDVMDMYVGEGEKLVKAVFSLARRLSPCVVFLDEIDALLGARMSSRESGGAFAHRGVITEFMQEMDGLKSSKDDNIIVIGATNRPFDLDDAVLRRLPRRLLVDLPGEKERAEILKILLREEVLSPSVDIERLAKETPSFSGSDLKHLCVSAALDAVKERVKLPWSTASQGQVPVDNVPSSDSTESLEGSESDPSRQDPSTHPRILRPHNFTKALKEITPSSSEALSNLVRKWNDEFGEGRKDRKRLQVWGKGIFGFIDRVKIEEDGRILPVIVPDPTETRR